MIDDLIQKATHLPWLLGRLNQIKGRFDAEFHAYFVKDLLRDLMSEVDSKIPPIADDYRVGIAFLQFERITCATRADDEIFDRRVNELMGKLRLAS